MHIPTLDTTILIIVAVFAAFCFWKWLNWKGEAKFYTMMWNNEQKRNAYLFKENTELTEKLRWSGPKALAEDPKPYERDMQARIDKAPESALQVHIPEDTQHANIAWTRQDAYRLKMERNGFVRVVDERGRTRYTKVEKTAWIKSTKQWIRVSRDSKLFKEASFFFPGDYEKPTKNNYWKLLNRVHQGIEKADGREA